MAANPSSLLEKTRALIEMERSLTISLEKVEPWLTSNTLSISYASLSYGTRVRPIPATMDQVQEVLAVARNLSTRTSAPAGWNPNAPVVGFSTPNPMPHQLRGGALAALELERARQAERDKKRKRQEEEEKVKQQEEAEKKKTDEGAMEIDDAGEGASNTAAKLEVPHKNDPKAVEAESHLAFAVGGIKQRPTDNRRPARPQQAVIATTMNLSDSSSSDDDDND